MKLSLFLDKDAHAILDENVQGFYVPTEDGRFKLNADIPEPDADLEGLKAKRDELLGETKKEREKRQAAEAELQRIREAQEQAEREKAKESNDIDSLEKSFKAQLDKTKTDYEGKVGSLEKQIYNLTVGQTAKDIANELAIKGSSIALLPHIQNRLALETLEDGTQEIKVLDLQGNKTLMDLNDLKDEFRANDAFKPLIVGSNASGGGANGASSGADKGGSGDTPKHLKDCKTPEQKKAWLANNA